MKAKLSLLSAGLLCSSAVLAQNKPNVVIILADDMGYGDVSCNNPNGRIQTPAIDQMAQNGIRFTECHSAGALSGPSRYGLVTGRYFFRATPHNDYWGYLYPYIEKERLTIGSMMQRAGYNTACIGKWHLGLGWQLKDPTKPQILNPKKFDVTNVDFAARINDAPTERGFDYSFILPASLDMPPYGFVRNDRMVDSNMMLVKDAYPHTKPDTEFAWDRRHTGDDDVYWERGVWWRNGEMSRSFKFEDCLKDVVEEGIDFIERSANKKKPFFLYLPLTGPHTPWMASEESKGSTALGTYSDFIKDIDNVVAHVNKKLEELGVAENTIVIFASDNGAAWREEDIQQYGHNSNWNRRGQKGDAYDGGHHVPMVVYWPKHIDGGKQYEQSVGLIDIYATLAEVTGQKLVEGQAEDSHSFKSVMDGDMKTPVRDHILYMSAGNKVAIKKGDWKYIDCLGSDGFTPPYQLNAVKNGPQGQLYNMREDVMEQNNRYLSEPDKVKELKSDIEKYKKQGYSRPQ